MGIKRIRYYYYAFCIGIITLILAQGQVQSISNPENKSTALSDSATVNVKEFGATGEGIIDDSAAIQKALDSLSQKGGGTVFLPAGTYKIGAGSLDNASSLSVALKIGSFVNLLGAGAGKSILKVDAPLSSILNRFLINNKSGDSNISISHLTIDTSLSPLSHGSGSALSFTNATNVRIEDVEFKNVKREALSLASVSNFTIQSVVVDKAWTGIYLIDCSEGYVTDNTITSTGGDGILVKSEAPATRCTNLHIESNKINAANDTAIDISTAANDTAIDGSSDDRGTHHENIIVSRNIIQDNIFSPQSVGIRASDSRNMVISNNIIEKSMIGIVLDTPPAPPRSLSVSGNIINGFKEYGIIGAYAGAIIDDNSIYGSGRAIANRNNNSSSIDGVPVARSTAGIALQSDSLQVSNNHIENVDDGMRWTGDSNGCVIDGNVILSVNRYGITDDPQNGFNIHSHDVSHNMIVDNRTPAKMLRGINFEGSSTHNINIISNKILGFVSDPAIKVINTDNQLSSNEIGTELPSGNFTIRKGTSDETITISNKHVTSTSLIILTFNSNPNTIDSLYVASKLAGSSFNINVNAHKPTTNDVKVAYMIVN